MAKLNYIVLLRGINVGGHNKLPMADLRAALTEAGFTKVRSYIQSGNLVLTAPSNPREKIEALLKSRFAIESKALCWTAEQFQELAAANPFADAEPKSVHYFFCADIPALDVKAMDLLRVASERVQTVGKMIFLHAPDGIGRSKLAAAMDRTAGTDTTARNGNTVNKLLAMLD